jgi:hypothetical protein
MLKEKNCGQKDRPGASHRQTRGADGGKGFERREYARESKSCARGFVCHLAWNMLKSDM